MKTKNILLIILLLMSTVVASAGIWKIHNIYVSTPTELIDTGDKVYSLVDGFLYCYEKDSDEFNTYNKGNYLHDSAIKQIYYNYEKKYLVVVYTNSNIDIIQDNGKVINISDIKETSITASKNINDVTFATDRAYLATDFGYVVINDKKFEILESRIFYKALTSVAQVGDVLFLASADAVYYDNVKSGHNSLSQYMSKSISNARLFNFGNESKFALILPSSLEIATISGSGETLDFTRKAIYSGKVTSIQQRKSTGNYFAQVPSVPLIIEINGDGTYAKINMPTDLKNEKVSSFESSGHWWTAGVNGLRNIEIKDDGSIATLIDYMRLNASSITDPKHLQYNETQKKLYVANTGLWWYNNTLHCKGIINTFDGETWEDITLPSVPTTRGNRPYLYSIFNTVFNPLDPNMYFIETYFEGVYVVKDGQVINKYDWTNSPLGNYIDYNCNVPNGLQFDKDNNLWIVQAYDSQLFSPVVLPPSKITKTDLTASDWIVPNISFIPNWRQVFLISKKHNVAIYNSGTWGSDLIAWDCNGSIGESVKQKSYSNGKLLDQDGGVVNWTYLYCLSEDKNGKVWVGYKDGVFELDPENIFSENFHATRLKVPRGDGTNYADYLLDGIPVMCITPDAQNRKWIGTNGSGLFLVSADGSKVLEQFTTKNSVLSSDVIYSVVCNPNTGAVYISTPNGMLEYSGDGSTPSDDLSNVYVYPNPVRPEYTGMISITGLLENTLVKIANASGTIVKSLMSSGGTVTWDGCNESGERVRSGVYYVLASKREGDSNTAAVAKFLIVR